MLINCKVGQVQSFLLFRIFFLHTEESFLRIWVKTKNCQILNLENLPEMMPWFHACFSLLTAHFCYPSKLKICTYVDKRFFSVLSSTKWDNTNKHCVVVEYLREKQLSKWSVLYTASGGCAFTKDRARLTLCKNEKKKFNAKILREINLSTVGFISEKVVFTKFLR